MLTRFVLMMQIPSVRSSGCVLCGQEDAQWLCICSTRASHPIRQLSLFRPQRSVHTCWAPYGDDFVQAPGWQVPDTVHGPPCEELQRADQARTFITLSASDERPRARNDHSRTKGTRQVEDTYQPGALFAS